jgi:hypothetical protein
MKIRALLPIFVLTCLFNVGNLYSQEGTLSSQTISKVGTSVAQFLKLGISARTIGMGGAFVAVADDIGAIYDNPAGLATLNSYEVIFTHTEWLVGTDFDFGALGLDLGNVGTFGLMIMSFSSGDIPVTTVQLPDGTGELFDVNNLAIGITYARSLTDNFAIGITAKYISEQIWHMSAASVALDVGTLFTTPFWGIQLGASITNFGSPMSLEGRDIKFSHDPDPNNIGNVSVVNAEYEMKDYPIPLRFQVGLAKQINLSESNRVTIAIDALHPNDNFESVNTGLEYGFKGLFFLRGGYKSLFLTDSEEGFTAGFGANIRIGGSVFLKADYAYADFGRLDNAQRFSLMVRF